MAPVTIVLTVVAVAAWSVCVSAAPTDVELDPEAADDLPFTGVFSCLDSNSPTACFRTRAIRALEDLLPQDDEKDTDDKMPKGMSPAVGRLVDRVGEYVASSVSQWYPEPAPEDGDAAAATKSVEEARGKKKVHKAMKKLIIKGLILLYVKQQAIRLFLYSAQTFIFFKIMVFLGIFVLTHAVKVITFLSWHHHEKHHSPKVLYIEPQIKHVTQHHAHVEDEAVHVGSPFLHSHHDEYAPEGYDYEPAHEESLWDVHRRVYANQIPPGADANTKRQR